MSGYWRGKRAVVTGGAGLIGAELVRLLLEARAAVVVLDNYSRGSTRLPGAEYVFGDAGDEGTCRDALEGADAVFNLAAEVAGVGFNQANHAWMFWRNLRVLGTPPRVAAEYGVPRFLQASSVCVYAPGRNAPAVEAAGMEGRPAPANAGYAWAKRMGEMVVRWLAQEKGLHAVVVRPSNAYGPRDYFDDRAHVIPALIRKCVEDDVVVANGTGDEAREFIYSADVAEGMLAAAERGRPGGAYNLGAGGETSVTMRELLGRLLHLTGAAGKEVRWERRFDAGDDRRWSDCSLAERELLWKYRTPLADGLRATVDWYLREGGRDG